jgi:hypothetical protein
MISDPAGLLARIPELEPLAADASVRKAIERGDVHGLYRVLFWANLFGRLRHHRDTIRMLLARRRLFLMPIRSAPSLMTVNGVGARGYGHGDPDHEDGTYILTHYVVFAFIPLFPIRQYLVHDAESSGHSRAWSFIGKVPLGPFAFFWNRLLALMVAAVVVAGAASAWGASRYHDVHFVNATGIPVRAHIAGESLELPSGTRKTVRARVGTRPVHITTADGATLQSDELEVEAGKNILIYNVLGAGLVYRENVLYGSRVDTRRGSTQKPTVACGESVVRFAQADDLFDDPPRTISTSKSSGTTTRTHVDFVHGGPQECISYLLSEDMAEKAVALAKRSAEVTGYGPELAGMTVHLLGSTAGPLAALAFAERARAARPDDTDIHRLYQNAATAAGKREEVVAEYRKRREQKPDDADAGYLLARLEPAARAVTLLDPLVRRFPDHVAVRRAHAFNHYQLRHFDIALDSWKALRLLAPQEMPDHLPLRARALVAVGRGPQALSEIEAAFDDRDADGPRLAELYARVARAIGKDAERLFGKLGDQVPPVRVLPHRALAGLPVKSDELSGLEDPAVREMVSLALAARKEAGEALALAARASSKSLRMMDDETLALIYAEAVRLAPADKSTRALAEANAFRGETLHAIDVFVKNGQQEVGLDEASFEVRAAAEFVRSRSPGVPAAERKQLLASARRDDLLHGPVTAAIDGWQRGR